MDIKKNNVPNNTVTRKLTDIDAQTGNIYESVVVISRRANQIATQLKQELNRKLADFSSTTDTLGDFREQGTDRDIPLLRKASEAYPHRNGGVPRRRSLFPQRDARDRAAVTAGFGSLRKNGPSAVVRQKVRNVHSAVRSAQSHEPMFSGKHILLGVTGSIAAYKAAVLTRSLVKEGAEVKVVMTPLAKQFITPLTMATLSRHPILVDFFNPENGEWNSHVSLGTWADLYLIAPATANTIGKMAHGIADNLLLTCYLSARCPVALAPAMDLDMYAHPTTQENIEKLRNLGVRIIEPGSGELASGLTGKGRMAEPEEIIEQVRGLLP